MFISKQTIYITSFVSHQTVIQCLPVMYLPRIQQDKKQLLLQLSVFSFSDHLILIMLQLQQHHDSVAPSIFICSLVK